MEMIQTEIHTGEKRKKKSVTMCRPRRHSMTCQEGQSAQSVEMRPRPWMGRPSVAKTAVLPKPQHTLFCRNQQADPTI